MSKRGSKRLESIGHYTYWVSWSAKDDLFLARVLEFPLLAAHGDTKEKALKEIQVAVEGVIEDMIESGKEKDIPEPFGERSFSGKFVVRIAQSLHRKIAYKAAMQGLSLNQLVMLKLNELALED